MPAPKWRLRPTRHFGEVWVPFVHVDVHVPKGPPRTLLLLVDSGAVISLLRRSMARLLGLQLEAGRRVELSSVGGRHSVAFVHELDTQINGHSRFMVPFAIAEKEEVPNLLGRLGVFERLQITFDGARRETYILPAVGPRPFG